MGINKNENKWIVDTQPNGRHSKRYRKSFTTKAEAMAYEVWIKTQETQTPDWAPAKRDVRRVAELVDIWYEHHGVNLKAGKDTYNRHKMLCVALGNLTMTMRYAHLSPDHLQEARTLNPLEKLGDF